jgi:hypothetical protein
MEIKILNSILFKELMPWVFNSTNLKPINEKLKKIGSKEATTEAELIQQLQILVADYPELSKWLAKQLPKATGTIKNHCFAIDLTDFSNATTKFYDKIISLETLRIYNAFNTKIQHYKNKIDIVYNTNIALKNIRALAINTVKEIKVKGFEEAPTEQSELVHFVLQLLRQHLIILFFDIQELRKSYLDDTTSVEDFYLLDLELPKALIKELKQLESVQQEEKETIITQEQFTFGFKDDVAKLQIVINQLCTQVELLNEDVTEADELINALTAKKLVPNAYTIKLACETKMFRYIIDKLQPYFTGLSLANIQKSAIFYSNQDKENKPITSGNLSSSKNKSAVEPKEKATIDKIFKHLQ